MLWIILPLIVFASIAIVVRRAAAKAREEEAGRNGQKGGGS